MDFFSLQNTAFGQPREAIDSNHAPTFGSPFGFDFSQYMRQPLADRVLPDLDMITAEMDWMTHPSTLPETVSGQQGTKPFSRLPPTTKDWETHRQIITQLYKVEKRSLKEVQSFMESNHNFKASDNMYKKRISGWKIGRNLRWTERDEICRVVKQRQMAGKTQHTVVVRGHLLSTDQISRQMQKMVRRETVSQNHCKHHHEDADISIRSPVSSPRALHTVRSSALTKTMTDQVLAMIFTAPAEIRSVMYPPGDEKSLEICFVQTRNLFETAPSAIETNFVDITSLCNNANRMANLGKYQEARILLGRACENLRQNIALKWYGLLPEVIKTMVFYPELQNQEFNVTQIFCQYAIDLCYTVLGQFHPMTTILVQCRKLSSVFEAQCCIVESVLATFEKYGRTQDRAKLMVWLRLGLLESARILGLTDRAIKMLRQTLELCDMYEVDEYYRTCILVELARLKIETEECEEATTIFWEIGDLGSQEDDDVLNAFKLFQCYRGLVKIAEKSERLDEAEEYYQKGLDAALIVWGVDDDEVFYLAECLAQVLERRGKLVEAQAVRDEHALVDELAGLSLESYLVEEVEI